MLPKQVSNSDPPALVSLVTRVASTCLVQTLRLPQDPFPEEACYITVCIKAT
jgi:hypothetical protein